MTKKKLNTTKNSVIFFGVLGVFGVLYFNIDLYNKDKCEWYLIPDLKNKHLIEPGWVSLCARNHKINRQKCYLQSKIELAEAVYGKTIRYSDMKINEDQFPRVVLSVPLCEAGS